MRYRTRYAPSPTGAMHLGHARTALVAWLRARTSDGAIVMRIEDLDTPRVRDGSEASILRDHEWLGLDWDEGPVRQSERHALYDDALNRLERDGRLFDCSCTRRELREASAPHEGERSRYPGTCYEGAKRPERDCAKRFRMRGPSPAFVDLVAGEVAAGGHEDDFIVRRSDGLYAYQLAVVVDDAAQEISEVVRGDDLLSSTPQQIALYHALGYEVPAFMHLPLVRNDEGIRLSKRDGAIGVADYRDAGVSKEALLAVLARSLGFEVDTQISLDELRERFGLQALRDALARTEANTHHLEHFATGAS